MPRYLRSRPGTALRSYAAAAFLNLALVSTTLTLPERPRAAQTRIVTNEQRFHPTELLDLGGCARGVLSMPYSDMLHGQQIGEN